MEKPKIPTSTIKSVRWSIASESDINSSSFVTVTESGLFKYNKPVPHGVFDKHMGTTDHNLSCDTCHNEKKYCLGHDGKLILNYPVINPMTFSDLLKWIKLICFNCGYPILSNDDIYKLPVRIRLKEASRIAHNKSAKIRTCKHCETVHPAIMRDPKDYLVLLASREENKVGQAEVGQTEVAKDVVTTSDVVTTDVKNDVKNDVNNDVTAGIVSDIRNSDVVTDNTANNIVSDVKSDINLNPGMEIDGGAVMTNIDETRTILYPHLMHRIFDRIPDGVISMMGRPVSSHPRNFIVKTIRIPSNTIRPDVKKIGGGRSNSDDITTILQFIIKKNSMLSSVIPEEINPKYEKLLYELNYAYFSLIKGSVKTAMVTNINASYSSLAQKMKSKQGQFRKYMMGKRVFLSARSTIIGDSTLQIGEIGIPMKFAQTLQIEEYVQEYNYERMLTYFNNGTKKYPGCTKIIKRNTMREHGVDSAATKLVLEIGDVIYRDIIDGDYVSFCRQPSLMPSNITTMRVVVNKNPNNKAIRMNVISTPWFNADFDGDQMNIYVNTSEAARNEIRMLSAAENHFMSHAKSSPMIGQVDDSIIGLSELTRPDVRLDKHHAMMLFANCSFLPDFSEQNAVFAKGKVGEQKLYTGWDIITKLLSETPINFEKMSTYYKKEHAEYVNYDPREIKVIIKNGVMLQGILDKASVAKGSSGIFQVIHNKFGAKKALEVMHNFQQVAINYLSQCGYTVSIMDFMISRESRDRIAAIESEILKESDLMVAQLNRQEIISPIGQTIRQFYEMQQIATLRIMDQFAEPIFKSIMPRNNGLYKLTATGSKGNMNHVYQTVGTVGQALINGERVHNNFGYYRSSPYTPRFDTSATARGYITNSYIGGMTVSEMICAARASRVDLIHKALSTSITGEQNRNSIKNLETIITTNLRQSTKGDNVIQLLYGESGFDTRYVEKVKFPFVMMSDDEMKSKYVYKSDKPELQSKFDENFAQLVRDRDEYRRIYMTYEEINEIKLLDDTRTMPVNLPRIIEDAKVFFESVIKGSAVNSTLVASMSDTVRKYVDEMPYLYMNDIQRRRKGYVPEYIKSALHMCEMMYRLYLCDKALSEMNPTVLSYILDECTAKFQSALISYGTAVGIIAAQSFSEPLTQYMLDAHHRNATGGTSKNEMQRAREVLGAAPTERMSAPHMMLCVKPEIEGNKNAVQEIANNIEIMVFKQFVTMHQIFFEKFGEPIHPDYVKEADMIQNFVKMNPAMAPPSNLIKWCIRYTINKTAIVLKNMPLELIVNKLTDNYPNLYIVYTPENSKNIILRVYVRNDEFKNQINEDGMVDYSHKLLNTNIRGVPGITSTEVVKHIKHAVGSDGKLSKVENKWRIRTEGINTYGVLSNPNIVPDNVITNSIQETFLMYGIEAARQKIMSEMDKIGEGGINNSHYTIYADEMTYTGNVTSIHRSGLSTRERNNIFLRLGFAAPIQTLEEAGLENMEDRVNGITSKLLLGCTPVLGTSYNKFTINADVIRKNTRSVKNILDEL